MPIEIAVPDIGNFNDVPVIEVHVKPGDTVAAEEPLITLESDKATMDVPAPQGGTVAELRVKLGDRVSQGSVILLLEAAGEGTSIVALSLSSVISGPSAFTLSPTAACTSMTDTSLKSPMSGTTTSMVS